MVKVWILISAFAFSEHTVDKSPISINSLIKQWVFKTETKCNDYMKDMADRWVNENNIDTRISWVYDLDNNLSLKYERFDDPPFTKYWRCIEVPIDKDKL